ncbi:hypothetical protein K0M31_012745 [Melipona bicolor]|uniref:Uncharacterized protein n=1 Tax=Melipona bicolor TaxID=60889 RepID=A0AA40KH25_9HYME|nr:hypothetical protein K0M31_012745 [Melipona bicolor]
MPTNFRGKRDERISLTRESAGDLRGYLRDSWIEMTMASVVDCNSFGNDKFSADKTRYAFEASGDCTDVVQGRACRRHCSRLLYIAPLDIKREDLARTVPPDALYSFISILSPSPMVDSAIFLIDRSKTN